MNVCIKIDDLNTHDQEKGLDLRTEDFAWMTEQVMGKVNRQPSGLSIAGMYIYAILSII